LSNTGPIALLQDLAVVAALGLQHVERNGHHYFRGLDAWPREIQQAVTSSHPDIYHSMAGLATLNLQRGKINLASVLQSPLGTELMHDITTFSAI